MTKPLRIAFMGTPDFVIPVLDALKNSDHDLVCVYAQPPREKGRKRALQKSPTHVWADENNIKIRHPINFKSVEDIDAFKSLDLDVAIVAAYGMLVPSGILEAPKFGCINIHPSLLPRWRGPSPIQYAIWKGDTQTGVSVMSLEKSMDTGPIIAQSMCNIKTDTTFSELNKTLWAQGVELLMKALESLSKTRTLNSTPQSEEGVTYCKLLTKEDGQINWSQTAQEIDCQIRGLNSWPGTYSFLNSKRIKILEACLTQEKSSETVGAFLEQGKIVCGNNSVLQLITLQPENKKPMSIEVALNGEHIKQGDVLS